MLWCGCISCEVFRGCHTKADAVPLDAYFVKKVRSKGKIFAANSRWWRVANLPVLGFVEDGAMPGLTEVVFQTLK